MDDDDKREIFDDVLETVDRLIEDFIDEPDGDLPLFGMACNPTGMGLIPLAHLVQDELSGRLVASVMLPKVLHQMGASAFGLAMTVWSQPIGEPVPTNDEEIRALELKLMEDGSKTERVMVIFGFSDGMIWGAYKTITRVEGSLPEMSDWEEDEPVEWQGDTGVIFDSAMGSIMGMTLMTKAAIDELATSMAMNDEFHDEMMALMIERGFDPDAIRQNMDERGEPTPELELAILSLPEEFKQRVVEYAKEHAPEPGEAELRFIQRRMRDREREPHRRLARDIYGRISRR